MKRVALGRRVRVLAQLFGLLPEEFRAQLDESENLPEASANPSSLEQKVEALELAARSLRTVLPDDTIPKWMRHPLTRLGGISPLSLLATHRGDGFAALAREVEDGVYA